ncbi:MAG: hypothetical protein AVDCRST_MAG20-2920, partial [uncultured Acidimicrobiales bacterium]
GSSLRVSGPGAPRSGKEKPPGREAQEADGRAPGGARLREGGGRGWGGARAPPHL